MSLSLSEIVAKIAGQGSNPDISFLKDNPEAQALLLSAIVSHVKPPAIDDKRKYDQIEQQQEPTKKVGRKPVSDNEEHLEDDAQSKRKAQNRAAQRAFRERKENQVKLLEDKVKELEAHTSGKNETLLLENEKLKEAILKLQNENASLLGSAVSFDSPLSFDDDMRPQKVIRQQFETSPTSTHLESLSSGYSISSKSRSNTPETANHQLTVDDILGNAGLPSDTLLDHSSELFGKIDYNTVSLNDLLQQPNFHFETDPSLFYPLENTTDINAFNLNTSDNQQQQQQQQQQPAQNKQGDVTQVWDKLSEHPRFDEIDIDDLCDKMKKKAVCYDFDHDKEVEKYINTHYPNE